MKEHETNREEAHAGGGEAAASRLEKRKQLARRATYGRALWRIAALLAVLCCLAVAVWKGFEALKKDMERGSAMERFEQALREKDMSVLKMYVRSDEVAINDRTLAPLFAYMTSDPKAYDALRRDLEKQLKKKDVYIKGLTSVPPVFTMKVYETNVWSFSQYVFEPTLYSFLIRHEEEAEVIVNGEPAHGTATKDPLVKKYGPYLPGQYEVTVNTKQGRKTKTIVLFGGNRVRELQF